MTQIAVWSVRLDMLLMTTAVNVFVTIASVRLVTLALHAMKWIIVQGPMVPALIMEDV